MNTKSIVYFREEGASNTRTVVETVTRRVAELGIRHVVVASTSGRTALEFVRAVGVAASVVCVTYHAGWGGRDDVALDADVRADIEAAGGRIVMGSHALSGVCRSIGKKFGGVTPPDLVAETLRFFGEGVKVAVEVALMAADAGMVPTDRDIIAVGGSGSGCDAAIVLKAAHQNSLFELRVREVLAMVSGF